MSHYLRFFAMIAVSALLMHGLMYLHTWELDHVYNSQTRIWMTLIMASGMMVVMLLFMRSMYRNRAANLAILAGAAILFSFSLWAVRSQRLVDDVAWMKAMIPHHSIAILTSTRARITDPRVKELADGIITAQEREIAEMKSLIAEMD